MLTTRNEEVEAENRTLKILAGRSKDEISVLKTQYEEAEAENRTLKRKIEQVKKSSKVVSQIYTILHC